MNDILNQYYINIKNKYVTFKHCIIDIEDGLNNKISLIFRRAMFDKEDSEIFNLKVYVVIGPMEIEMNDNIISVQRNKAYS